MYDIFDDEIDEMYENKGKAGIKLGKGISPKDPLESLTQEKFIVLNEQATLQEAITNIQNILLGACFLKTINIFQVYLPNGILFKKL